MALTSFNDLKSRITEYGIEVVADNYPDDALRELADSEVPVYYGDIIEEWRDMPMSYSDRWQENGAGDNATTITSLMQADLYYYYLDQFHAAYNELCEEAEETEDQETN